MRAPSSNKRPCSGQLANGADHERLQGFGRHLIESLREGYSNQLAVLRSIISAEAGNGDRITLILRRAERIYQVRLAVCSSIHAAWRKVPLELWDKVFGYYLAAIRGPGLDPFRRRGADPDKLAMFAPSTLGAVCKAWRSIVASSSTVWADVTLSRAPVKGSDRRRPPLLRSPLVIPILTRLGRLAKQSLPWSLTIADGRLSESSTQDGVAFPLFLESQTALRFLERLRIRATHCPLNLSDMTIPSVTSLVVDAGGPGFADIPDLPNLTKAAFVNMVVDGRFVTHNPWASLTHLFIGNRLNPQHVNTVLRLCPALRKACFWLNEHRSSTSPWQSPAPQASTTRSPLEELDIACGRWDMGPTSLSFDGLSFPSITRLRIFFNDHWVTLDRSQTHSFVNLTHLTLVGGASSHKLVSFLDTCPFLQDLFACVEDSTFSAYVGALTLRPTNAKAQQLHTLGQGAATGEMSDSMMARPPWE